MNFSSISGKKWLFKKFDSSDVLKFTEDYSLSEIVAKLLSIRKKDIDDVNLFLDPKIKNLLPNPFHLKDMDVAVNRTYKSIINKYLESNTIENPRQIWWKIRPHIEFGTIEFRICDAQRSLRNIEMLTALAQALVYRAVEDYSSGILIESFNLEFLNDGLWKAARFPLDIEMIDPANNEVCTLLEQIEQMMDYVHDSLQYFNNMHIIKTVHHICNNGTEGDEQIKVYLESGIEALKQYLMDDIEFRLS